MKTKHHAGLLTALVKTKRIEPYKDASAIYNAMDKYFGYFGNYKGFMSYLLQDSIQNKKLEGSNIIEQFSKRIMQIK